MADMEVKDKKEKKPILESYGDLDLKMLAEITEADGISGCEVEASRVMKQYMEELVDEITYDNLGSIIGLKKGGSGPKIMLAGHLDEVGFMVKKIEDDGYIRLAPIGGWWGHVLPAQELRITTRKGDKYYGIIGTKAPHGLPAEVRAKVMDVSDMYLDLGISGKEEVESLGIRVGDMVTPTTAFKVMTNPNFLMAKAWDDRVGAAIIIDVLRELKDESLEAHIYGVGTVQEEVGLRGAKTAAYAIQPDIAISLDVTLASDIPGGTVGVPMACGVCISLSDASHIDHRGMIRKIEEICEDMKVDYTHGMLAAGGTDSGEIHKSFDGVYSLTLSVPSRSIHSHRSIIHRKDYIDTVKVLAEFCRRANSAMLEELKESVR